MEIHIPRLPNHQVNPRKIPPGQRALLESVNISYDNPPQSTLQEHHWQFSNPHGNYSTSRTHVHVPSPVSGTL